MEIIVGKTAGFCYGVERSVNGAKQEIQNNDEVYCLGEIVHNQTVIDELKNEGIKFIENIEEAKGHTIIRAHGASKEIYEKAKKMNLEIKDLTCPSVLKIHKIAEEYSKNGYYIILTGEKNHPEIIGTQSYCGDKCLIASCKEDIINNLEEIKKQEKILLISQTTFKSSKFDEIADLLSNNINSNLEIKKTICQSTEIRQKETEELAKKVDCMIIIGGKKSSNTRKLYDISCEFCNNVLFISKAEELEFKKLLNAQKVGIMAGASTPKEEILKVEEIISKS